MKISFFTERQLAFNSTRPHICIPIREGGLLDENKDFQP